MRRPTTSLVRRRPIIRDLARLTALCLFLALTACSTVQVNVEGTEKKLDWGLGIYF